MTFKISDAASGPGNTSSACKALCNFSKLELVSCEVSRKTVPLRCVFTVMHTGVGVWMALGCRGPPCPVFRPKQCPLLVQGWYFHFAPVAMLISKQKE